MQSTLGLTVGFVEWLMGKALAGQGRHVIFSVPTAMCKKPTEFL
jgi:hypothetical protein